jgi:hypothetical protein
VAPRDGLDGSLIRRKKGGIEVGTRHLVTLTCLLLVMAFAVAMVAGVDTLAVIGWDANG